MLVSLVPRDLTFLAGLPSVSMEGVGKGGGEMLSRALSCTDPHTLVHQEQRAPAGRGWRAWILDVTLPPGKFQIMGYSVSNRRGFNTLNPI